MSERAITFPIALGVGIRGTYYISRDGRNTFLWVNAVSADVQYLVPRQDAAKARTNNPGGVGFEAVIGRDGIVGSGIGIVWGVGIATAFDHGEIPLIMPAVRLGVHIDM